MRRFIVALIFVAGPAAARVPDIAALESMVVESTNRFRAEEGRAAVAPERHLEAAAREFAAFMARTDRYGHTADGREPADRAKAHGYDYCLVSENISYQYSSLGFRTGELATRLVDGWKKSPGHRRNMLDEGATHTAVAVAHSGATGRYYAVQLFGRPRSQQVRFRVRNEAGVQVRYRIGEQDFTLGPRETHTHERCARETLRLEGRTRGPEPRQGEDYTIARVKGDLVINTSRASSRAPPPRPPAPPSRATPPA